MNNDQLKLTGRMAGEMNGVELCEFFLAYCEKRVRLARDPRAREWWKRMAGNARKATTM